MNTTTIRSDRSERARGFTLVEMLVVIGIIVVLAGLLLPVLMRGWNQAKSTAIRQTLSAVEQALNAYKSDFGDFPKTKLDNSIEGPLPSPTMGGWDIDINKSGLRGARMLCKALVGIGPQGGLDSATYPASVNTHVVGQDGFGDPTDPIYKAGPGFRVAGRGGDVNSNSRKYNSYLNMDAFRVAESSDASFDLRSPYFPKNYTFNGTGYTVPDPVGAGAPLPAGFWDRFVILDSMGRPILYYPELNSSADIHADYDNNVATGGNFITTDDTVAAARASKFRATDNHIGSNLAIPPSFPGLGMNTFKLYMGDMDLDGKINAGTETAATTIGYVLWSSGVNMKFNTATTVATKKGDDDVTNIQPN